jgi:para-nitrobenzyl esterase
MKNIISVLLIIMVICTLVIGCGDKAPITTPAPTTSATTTPPTVAVVEPDLEDPIVTDSGLISGMVINEAGRDIHVYKGIPYAAPPVGDLRWKSPQPPDSWSGVRECTEYSLPAPQINLFIPTTFEQSEDCLYLNVHTPAQKGSDSLPVIVFMHGGGYSFYSGNDPIYNLSGLPRHGVVLVTVNMRLNVIGLLAHPLLSGESPNGVSGNYMFLDMIASLEWVQTNIEAFGGDPDNVTIFGEAGGGCKVSNLMASPLAEGLFHRAILASGTATEGGFPSQPLENMEALGQQFFAQLGINEEADPLKAARSLPWETLLEFGATFSDAVVDGWFLTDTPANIFKKGEQNPVPFITVANLGEITGPGSPFLLFPCWIPGYTNMLANADKAGVKGYAAIFEHVPSNWKAEGGVATHMMALPYFFGDMNPESEQWHTLLSIVGFSGVTQSVPGLTEVDRQLSENIMAMWAQFARTGDPSVPGLVEWPAYDVASDRYLSLDEELQIKSGFSQIAPEEPTTTPTPTTPEGQTSGFEVSGTVEQTELIYDAEPVTENGKWMGQGTSIWDVTGTMEGTFERTWYTEIELAIGRVLTESETTFTGTVDGKQGSFITRDIATGQMYSSDSGFKTNVAEIISGTGELANLRGTITIETNLSSSGEKGTYSGTLYFEDEDATTVNVYTWQEAIDHIGETATVTGLIINAALSSDNGDNNIVILGMGKRESDPEAFRVILRVDSDNLPGNFYVSDIISVTGEIYMNSLGGASIDVTDLSQIVVK